MGRHQGTVLVDTNVILESHRVRSWPALAGGYRVETVEACVREMESSAFRPSGMIPIDHARIREQLANIHTVRGLELAALGLRLSGIPLDFGEKALWAHAVRRDDEWVFCGPDAASLRCGVHLGFRERLVSLECLLRDCGHRPRTPLRPHYTERWHQRTLSAIMIHGPRTDE